MTTENLTITKLSAAEGKVLYNGETYAKDVYLPYGEDPSKWTEVDESEVPQESDALNEDNNGL